jgi:pimeloyl-ACP methyl ester carboxylesterase
MTAEERDPRASTGTPPRGGVQRGLPVARGAHAGTGQSGDPNARGRAGVGAGAGAGAGSVAGAGGGGAGPGAGRGGEAGRAGASGGIERLEIDANGLRFSARAAGPAKGRPVLLLHGFPQSSLSWQPVMRALAAAGYRAVAPDQRGYSAGARPGDVDAYRVSQLVSDVLAIAETMQMGRFDLVGHDWGGMIAWVTAARHPGSVRSLSVVSTPHPGALAAALSAGDPDQTARSAYVHVFRRSAEPERMLLGEDGHGEGLRSMFNATGLDDSQAVEYVSLMQSPGAMTAALNWYRAMDPADVEGLPPVVVPTLYVWSTGDAALGRKAAESTAEFVAGRYQFVTLDGVSHWVPEEAPDELARLLLGHLGSVGS